MIHAFKSSVVAVFALWCLAATAAAGPIEDAVAARIKGDTATALRILRPLADKGDAAAQSNLALMYATGQGVPISFTEAAKWYRLAADQGRANAQYNLGRMHATGQGMPPNLAEALKWWRAAADQGHSAAQYNLGLMYAEGRGVPQNSVEAAKWWRLAAEQGDTPSQFNLGVAYSQGKGVVQNTMEATKWYRQAADRNHTAAQVNLGTAYDQGRGVIQNDILAYLWLNIAASKGDQMALKARDAIAKRMTPAQIAEAQRATREWKPIPPRRSGNSAPPSRALRGNGYLGTSSRQTLDGDCQSFQIQPHLVQPPIARASAITPERMVSRLSII